MKHLFRWLLSFKNPRRFVFLEEPRKKESESEVASSALDLNALEMEVLQQSEALNFMQAFDRIEFEFQKMRGRVRSGEIELFEAQRELGKIYAQVRKSLTAAHKRGKYPTTEEVLKSGGNVGLMIEYGDLLEAIKNYKDSNKALLARQSVEHRLLQKRGAQRSSDLALTDEELKVIEEKRKKEVEGEAKRNKAYRERKKKQQEQYAKAWPQNWGTMRDELRQKREGLPNNSKTETEEEKPVEEEPLTEKEKKKKKKEAKKKKTEEEKNE